MAKSESSIREHTSIRINEPRRFKVIIFNDDFTTMDFVVKILMQVFFKQREEAENLMMDVHRKGQAVVGVYAYDIAKSKVNKSMDMARQEGFPLRLVFRPE